MLVILDKETITKNPGRKRYVPPPPAKSNAVDESNADAALMAVLDKEEAKPKFDRRAYGCPDAAVENCSVSIPRAPCRGQSATPEGCFVASREALPLQQILSAAAAPRPPSE
jgi:hypothetical protein